jgi:hypothetical protein
VATHSKPLPSRRLDLAKLIAASKPSRSATSIDRRRSRRGVLSLAADVAERLDDLRTARVLEGPRSKPSAGKAFELLDVLA